MSGNVVFRDRSEAGAALARKIEELHPRDPVILALPRGGVPVGFEIARRLHAPLDVILVRKIGAPGHSEYGIGAVVDGAANRAIINHAAARAAGADQAYIDAEVARELERIEQRRAAYRHGPPVPIEGRTAIVVDDGIATGNTAMVALQALGTAGAAKIVLAVPVAPRDTLDTLRAFCDEIVCLATPSPFYAVGAHYRDFGQTSDAEVIQFLHEARLGTAGSADQR